MLYFSYGSFLDSQTLRRHCPKAVYMGKAILPNWEVQFNFLSRTYNGGVTGIEQLSLSWLGGFYTRSLMRSCFT